MFAQATKDRDDRTVEVTAIEDVAAAAADGFVRIPWDSVGLEGEERLGRDALTVRCLQRADGSLPEADDEPGMVALVARSY
jgi:prolyl-tRNA synthetase